MPITEVGPEDRRQLQDVADVLASSRRAVVFTGAGISTNIGIPDFRSENGLYSLIQARFDAVAQGDTELPTPEDSRSTSPSSQSPDDSTPACSQNSSASYRRSRTSLPASMKGKDLFDARIWADPIQTSIFHTFIAALRKKIREDVAQTTQTHKLIRALRDGGRLVRCYTQNIDGLEARDGLCTDMRKGKGNRSRFLRRVTESPRPDTPILSGSEMDGGCEVVQLHGDLDVLRCHLCNALSRWDEEDREARLLAGHAPHCVACASKDEDRRERGKRGTAVGILRPNVVLYGESHPSAHLLGPINEHDIALAPDVLLIMGTSLRVDGLKRLVKEFSKAVHARGGGKGKVIFVNNTQPPASIWGDVIDYWIRMDCDLWANDLRERRPDLWERQGTLKLPTISDTVRENGKPKPMIVLHVRKADMPAKPVKPRARKSARPDVATEDKENLGAKLVAKTRKKPMKVQLSANKIMNAKQVKPRAALISKIKDHRQVSMKGGKTKPKPSKLDGPERIAEPETIDGVPQTMLTCFRCDVPGSTPASKRKRDELDSSEHPLTPPQSGDDGPTGIDQPSYRDSDDITSKCHVESGSGKRAKKRPLVWHDEVVRLWECHNEKHEQESEFSLRSETRPPLRNLSPDGLNRVATGRDQFPMEPVRSSPSPRSPYFDKILN